MKLNETCTAQTGYHTGPLVTYYRKPYCAGHKNQLQIARKNKPIENRTLMVGIPPFGQVIQLKMRIHSKAVCDHACALHKPSDHHMKTWPIVLRMDREDMLIERTCEHGIGHPDPDSLAYITSTQGSEAGYTASIHNCDGDCRRPDEKE